MARKQSRRKTAFHEAGHAVIARVLTLACGGGTIKPDYEELTAGMVTTAGPYATIHQWEKRGKVRNPDAVFHARIVTYMAGAEAVEEFFGLLEHGDSDDRHQIALMAEELTSGPNWDKLEPRLRTMTRMLVRRHRVLIERVAKAFLARTTLSREELDELVGRSIDDVKVNAPLVLLMHQRRTLEK